MVKNKGLIYGLILIILLVALCWYVWSNYQSRVEPGTNNPIFPSPVSKKCGIENCHGLDITCGPNVSEACDAMYAAGDNCRQFARCQLNGSRCELQESPKLNACRECVKACEEKYKNNQMVFFECESQCSQ